MNILIFAGGSGTRLWPLSRKKSPKQFELLQGDQSTLQMAVERIRPLGLEHAFIATNEAYKDLVESQIPDLPEGHILFEPAKRDLAAAVGLALMRLKQQGVKGPIAMLWADHFMKRPDNFVKALQHAETIIEKNPNQFVFLAEQPRFTNQNLGWIHVGDETFPGEHKFLGWHYRPEKKRCDEIFASGEWLWNPGYFVFDIDFVLELYRTYQPQMSTALAEMVLDEEKLKEQYHELDALSFDEAIIEKIEPSQATVLKVDLGWSDPGTLYALKEALVEKQEYNYIKGKVVVEHTTDSFVHNEEDKLVATVGLDGIVVVNTKDALLVCHKDSVPDIKSLLKTLEDNGLEDHL
ncbi:MAG: hypothetical protein COU32_01800 [Candidatus Magasanikbacteria bacterium CG10_big_fil_rev_8_21_14_0_10_42_10]|uniref:Nucleotidyl transferase domain-containing protein n=2 Tax=Candidatus Magasanikiibacteriota TaxID=1752731 RepID=A0A2H0TWF7_9BACT|nr:MAG: hypothetical protein COU32_01800 [Candidatus Magasanikbacteria bacterium CG10_big_fil_rev_8_21_14_0_10_42_10]PIZ93755.1 MAG: hypothetical protein COX82_02070 [Candidatus Magasanikbacteria bacterium CG_4_10_14_0_2_um_filter_41_10]